MARSLCELHFVCHDGLNVVDLDDGTFLTGWWAVDPRHIREGQLVALHENRATLSYRQGVKR
jgi:hypothetical protein